MSLVFVSRPLSDDFIQEATLQLCDRGLDFVEEPRSGGRRASRHLARDLQQRTRCGGRALRAPVDAAGHASADADEDDERYERGGLAVFPPEVLLDVFRLLVVVHRLRLHRHGLLVQHVQVFRLLQHFADVLLHHRLHGLRFRRHARELVVRLVVVVLLAQGGDHRLAFRTEAVVAGLLQLLVKPAGVETLLDGLLQLAHHRVRDAVGVLILLVLKNHRHVHDLPVGKLLCDVHVGALPRELLPLPRSQPTVRSLEETLDRWDSSIVDSWAPHCVVPRRQEPLFATSPKPNEGDAHDVLIFCHRLERREMTERNRSTHNLVNDAAEQKEGQEESPA
mmetsp:Transcript_18673/g.46633  ORF Transcript_18673/g.46633 Transcript_18673/m.46633 type:complete len:336 (-) Transcript_18673:250-1257(-)